MTLPTPHAVHGFIQTELGYEQQQVEEAGGGRPSMWWTYTVADEAIAEILIEARGSNGTRQHAAVPSVRPHIVVIALDGFGAPVSTASEKLGTVSLQGFNTGHDFGVTGNWTYGTKLIVGVRGVGGDDAVPCTYTVTGLRFEAAR
jgi:hypothetical protein